MKLYKIVLTAVLVIILSTCAVSADSIAEISIADGEVYAYLTGSVNILDFGFSEYQLRTRMPYYPLQLAISVSDPETQKVLYTNQIQTEDDGTYSVKFILSAEEGTYNLVLSTAYCKVYDGQIEYRDGTVGKFNEICGTNDADALMEYMFGYNRYMNLDLSLFKQYTQEEKTSVLTSVMSKAPYESKADIRSALSDAVFNVGLSTESLGDEDKNRMFNEYIESLSEQYADIGAFITENELGAGIIACFNEGDYDSVKDEIYALSLKAFLTYNIENIFDLEALFEDNLFSIPEDVFKEYKETEQLTEFYTSLYERSDEIVTLDDFYKAVKKSIPEPEDEDEDTGRKTGGSGSGGKRSSYSGPSVAVADTSKDDVNTSINNVPSSSAVFSDLASCEWAQTAIYELFKIGAVNGSNGEFLPNNNIKREEFAKIAANAFGISKSAESVSFDDVSESDWFSEPISAMASNGIINGISKTEFGVGQLITRQDAATILSRILNKSSEYEGNEVFADDAEIAEYAKNGVYTLKNAGMISGYEDGTFRPYSNLTRAEAAQMIYNIMKLGKGGAGTDE